MTLTLDLSPAQERELTARAEREGIPVDEYALRRLLPSEANGDGKFHNVLELTAGKGNQNPVLHLLRDFADMMADPDWNEECLRPTQRAQQALFNLTDDALGLLPASPTLPRPLLYPDGDGGLRLEWASGDRQIRLAIHWESSERDYLYHQEGSLYGLEAPLTPTLLVHWLRWLSDLPK